MIDLENITTIRKRIGRKFGISESVIDFIVRQFDDRPPVLAVLGGCAYYSPKHIDISVSLFFKDMYPLGNGFMRHDRYKNWMDSDFKVMSHSRFGSCSKHK